ncbi:DUF3558 family protein [Actinopolyspora lacussalsi]|uniref:DUF3558 family protein n=1 Tax=Actinopolyspora righensis TaxID=995060 RepID=UPI001586FCB3|nr:DUF3558 family protein [Actinopolyspora righensis]
MEAVPAEVTEPVHADGTQLHGKPHPVMRNTLTTGISLAAGLLLLAGCSGQPDSTAQETTGAGSSTPTTSSASGVSLPERTAPTKNLDLSDPCTIVTKQQQHDLNINQKPEETNLSGIQGCKYQKGDSGAKGGWFVFVATNPNKTAEEFAQKRPRGQVTNIAGYPAYKIEKFPNCQISVNIANSGSLYVNGGSRIQENRPDPCPIFTEFAEAAIKNLPNA